VSVCLWSLRFWFDKRSGVWSREREKERELIEMACAWLTGASEGQSPYETTATRAIIPPRCIWISAMERSICLARGDTPPLADCRGCRERHREWHTVRESDWSYNIKRYEPSAETLTQFESAFFPYTVCGDIQAHGVPTRKPNGRQWFLSTNSIYCSLKPF